MVLCIFSYILSIFSNRPSTSQAVKVVTLESLLRYSGICFSGDPLFDFLEGEGLNLSGVAALTDCPNSDFLSNGIKEGVFGHTGGPISPSLDREMEVALLVVPVRLRTAGGGPMDPCFDDILLLGLFELLDPDPGLLVWPFSLVAIIIPPNWVVIETSLPDGFLGGAKMERSSAIFFLGVPLFRMVKLSVPMVVPKKEAPPL